MVCECILRWQNVTYHFGVALTSTLNSDLVFRKIMLGAYYLINKDIILETGIPNLVCECSLGWWSVLCYKRVTVTLNLMADPVFRIIMPGT